MADETPTSPKPISRALYFGTVIVVALVTFGIAMLWQNIAERKEEARETTFRIVNLTEDTIDAREWGKNFPRQYDGYLRTVDQARTRHGGSEAFQKLEADPRWREIFAGYAFSADYREERGHAYMLHDQDITERTKNFKQPGACLHCHASVLNTYRDAGRKAGLPDSDRQAQIMRGFELVNAMPYKEARKLVEHPVSCVDCHHPETMQLRVTRPGFLNGIRVMAKSKDPVPHFPSIERWRTAGGVGEYDPNTMASRQEMRSMVCGQCHVEYYFKGKEKLLTYPWHKGFKVEQIEAYYDEVGWKDWKHKISGANTLKAQHPEFELWSQGIHARSGVSCSDCHMPYLRQGAIKISDHHVRSPLLNVARACQPCHRFSEDELKSRAETIQDRTIALMHRAEEATVSLIHTIEEAQKAGATDPQLKAARDLQRKAQWRLDFIAAENSGGFHASQESARILGESIDFARQGEIAAVKVLNTVQSKPRVAPVRLSTR